MNFNQRDRIDSLSLPQSNPFDSYQIEDKEDILSNINLINIFVGANNSGKSRLLRELFSSDKYGIRIKPSKDFDASNFHEAQIQFNHIMPDFIDAIGDINSNHFDEYMEKIKKFINIGELQHSPTSLFHNKLQQLESENNRHFSRKRSGGAEIDVAQKIGELNHLGKIMLQKFTQDLKETAFNKPHRIYLPMLRGLRTLDNERSDLYYHRTKEDYFEEFTEINKVIFTGLTLYQELKTKLLGEPEDRAQIRKFEEYLSKNFFSSNEVALIPREDDNIVHVKIGDEPQLPIHQLGDGIQNLIILTYKIFVQPERALFFIEEPDLSMHPGIQRKFIEILLEFNQHQYFITTHSNHILDMTLDYDLLSVFLFSKKTNGKDVRFQVNAASSGDFNILSELGVKNSSVFLTNSTVWVEGITDRLYLREYFNKYLENKDVKFFEDVHFSFVEYQGSNLVHWSFEDDATPRIKAHYLCARSFLIADGDVSDKGNRAEEYQEMLGDRFHILSAKEIENFIPEELLKAVVKDDFESRGVGFDSIKYQKYSKSQTGLGSYLDHLLKEDHFAAKSGTVKNKIRFCEKVIDAMKKTEWQLPAELEELCGKIYGFIESQNT